MDQPHSIQLALAHTLSITTAASEDELIARTLAAGCELTGASVAVAVGPVGEPTVHGDPELTHALVVASAACLNPGANQGGLTTTFTGIGLPAAISFLVADTMVIVATTEPGGLGSENRTTLSLVAAHAQAGRERLAEIAALSRRANSDPLTGLRHQRPFAERLAASLPGRTAVIAIDIDDFKRINDEYGHQAGDYALVALVDALRGALRGDDQLYRIGGDEFAVVIDVNSPAEISSISGRLLEAARRAGHPISLGAAVRLPGETGRETLLRADKALYQAKHSGRDTARIAA